MGTVRIVRFEDVRQQAEETKQRRALDPDPVVVQLCYRLTNSDFRDSDSARLSMLTEMLYRIYLHHLSNQQGNL